MTDERKNALYDRDRRLNEPPASYTFRDPRDTADQKDEKKEGARAPGDEQQ
jgi:hypothetical protein